LNLDKTLGFITNPQTLPDRQGFTGLCGLLAHRWMAARGNSEEIIVVFVFSLGPGGPTLFFELG
jgi:hypothetical protein